MRLWLWCALAATAGAQTRTVQVDAGHVIGTIRSFQGVNAGPAPLLPPLADVSRQYKDLRIDLVRTHDLFGPTDIDARWPDPDPIARAVKANGANSVFPDWNRDPEKEASYNFGPSDRAIQAIAGCGAEVYFRVGRSWSADPSPPPDFDKYANIVRHVALHYNNGWARGFHYRIRYWEIWNEPDVDKAWDPTFVREFWSGTPRQFYQLFEKVARALKSVDPALQVGGPAKAGGGTPGPYREGLLEYCAAHKVPLDFYSWHHYPNPPAPLDPYNLTRIARQVRALLDRNGFPKAEVHATEWNISARPSQQLQVSMEAAAFVASAQIYLQDSAADRAHYYRGDATTMGLFDPQGGYRKKGYAFKAAGAMLETPRRLQATGGDNAGFAVLAGRAEDGATVQVLISNYEIPGRQYRDNRGYALRVSSLPWGKSAYTVKRYRTTPAESWAESESSGQGESFEMSNALEPPGVELIVIRRK
jgi:xylan 1,4-beta-xylosidase